MHVNISEHVFCVLTSGHQSYFEIGSSDLDSRMDVMHDIQFAQKCLNNQLSTQVSD